MKICLRCGKNFRRKSAFLRHLERIKNCRVKLLDVSYEEIKESYDDLLEVVKILKNDEKKLAGVSRLLADPSKINEQKLEKKNKIKKIILEKKIPEILECKFCHKIFKHKSSYSRHINKRCKMKNKIIEIKDGDELMMHNILKKIEETNMSSTINYYTTNTQNITNITNNTQNIIINNYGKEDISYITNNTLYKILNGPFASIQRTNKMIHFNKEHPENMNVKINNKKESVLEVYKGDKWCSINKNKVIKEMVERAMVLIDEYYQNEGNNSLPGGKNINYKKFIMAYNNSPSFKKRLHEDIELMIINGGLVLP